MIEPVCYRGRSGSNVTQFNCERLICFDPFVPFLIGKKEGSKWKEATLDSDVALLLMVSGVLSMTDHLGEFFLFIGFSVVVVGMTPVVYSLGRLS